MKRFKRSLDQGAFEQLVEDYAASAAAVSNQGAGGVYPCYQESAAICCFKSVREVVLYDPSECVY